MKNQLNRDFVGPFLIQGIVIPDQIRVIDTQVVILTPARKFGDVQLITGPGASQQCGIR